jgi:protein TonB
MSKGPPSQRYGTPNGRFWANVVLIALAHVALIAELIRWSVAAKASSNPESIVWLGGAGDLPADESEKRESQSPKQSPIANELSQTKKDAAADEKPVVMSAKSEIELPSATPKPTATPTPAKPTATPASKAKTTPKPIPSKTLVAKVSPKPAKPKSSPAKANVKSEKKDKIVLAKKDSAPQSGSSQSGSTNKTASASGLPAVASAKAGGNSASEFGWYGNMLHDRFYSAWIQPTANVPSGAKISTLVNVRIEKDGRVSKFEIAKPSGNATVNESVAAVAKQISHVDPPPTELIKGDHYDVKINFELNTEEEGSK